MIDNIRIVVRQEGGGHPLSPEFRLIREGCWQYPFHIIGIAFHSGFRQFAVKEGSVDGAVVPRIHHMGTSFGSQGIFPFSRPYFVLAPGKVHLRIEAVVVLYRAKYSEGFAVIKFHVIELSQWKFLDQVPPVLALVVRDRDAAVVGCQDVIGIIGIDPHPMLVHMNLPPVRFESSTAICGNIDPETQGINPVLIIGVYSNLGEYPSISTRVPRHIFLCFLA